MGILSVRKTRKGLNSLKPLSRQKKSRSCRDSCFENPGGGLTGKLFPTGNKQDILDVPGYGKLPVTLIDCANPVVIFKAEDAGLNGTETCIGACSVFIIGFSRLRTLEFFVFRKMEMSETKNHPLCGWSQQCYTKNHLSVRIELFRLLC